MATLSVIYRIAADISSLEANVSKGVSTMGRMESIAGVVGRSLAGAFTVGAIARFANDTLQAADRLERLSDTTGIGVEGLQDLEYAATQSGNTLDQVTLAISQMQNRLASGDSSAVSAVSKLSLSLGELRGLAPDQQFIAIAQAVASIEDPAVRVQVAMDLFGRSGAQLLPTLTADVRQLADEFNGLSTRQNEALDKLGDTIQGVGMKIKTFLAGALADTLDPVNAHNEAVEKMAATLRGWPGIPTIKQDSLFHAPNALAAEAAFTKLNGTLKQQAERMAAVATAAEKAKRAQDAWNESIVKATEKAGLTRFMLDNLRQVTIPDLTSQAAFFREELEGWIPLLESKAIQGFPDHIVRMNTEAQKSPEFFKAAGEGVKSLGTHIKELAENVPAKMGEMQDFLATKLSGFFGGGGVMHSIMSGGLNLIFGPASGLLVSLAMQGIQAMAGVIADGLIGLGKKLGDFFSWAWDGIKAIFAATGPGAFEPTPPTQTDPDTGIDYPDFDPIGPPATVDPDMPSFAQGTMGRYVDFGAGTLAMLHGRERVMTEREGAAPSSDGELRGLFMALMRQQRQLPKEIRDAILLAM